MAISRDKKQTLVAEISELLNSSKMTVFAKYQGLGVKDIEELRKLARESNVKIKVIKNRLIRVAIESNDNLKDSETNNLKGQLLYAFCEDDEVAPAQVLNKFAKNHSQLEFVGGLSNLGKNLSIDEVKELADLPSKEQLIGQTISQLLSPINDITNALSGNLHSLLDGVEAKISN